MAINQVVIPQQQSGMDKLVRLTSAAAPIVGIFNPPAGMAMAAGAQILGGNSGGQIPQTQNIDSLAAMRRRQNQSDPSNDIEQAMIALESMNLPNEQYQQYKAPLYAAINKSRSMT